MLFFSKIRQNRANQARDAAINQFTADVDRQAEIHDLDPNLPELVELKEDAGQVVDSGTERLYLGMINPDKDFSIHSDTGTFIVHERMFGGVLYPYTIVEHHTGELSTIIMTIIVDGGGMHLCDRFAHELVRYEAAVCNPYRMADDGNRLRNAAFLIGHHIGREFDWHKLIGALSITLTLDHQSNWQESIEYAPANA